MVIVIEVTFPRQIMQKCPLVMQPSPAFGSTNFHTMSNAAVKTNWLLDKSKNDTFFLN